MNDYKKPLEASNPPILPESKVETMFYRCSNIPSQISSKVVSIKKVLIVMDRVPEILQCHSQFRIALAEAVKNWDEVGVVDFRMKVVDFFYEAESGSNILQHISRRKRSGTSLSPLFPSRSSSRSTRTLSTTSARLALSSMIIIVIINVMSVATISTVEVAIIAIEKT